MTTFAQLIRTKREEKGISLYELARRSGIGYTTLYHLDKGIQKEIGIHKAIKVCKVLEIPSYLLMELNGED